MDIGRLSALCRHRRHDCTSALTGHADGMTDDVHFPAWVETSLYEATSMLKPDGMRFGLWIHDHSPPLLVTGGWSRTGPVSVPVRWNPNSKRLPDSSQCLSFLLRWTFLLMLPAEDPFQGAGRVPPL